MRKTARKNPRWVVPRSLGDVRFGIVGVVETIKDSSKDKKVPDRKLLCFGKPEVTADLGLGF